MTQSQDIPVKVATTARRFVSSFIDIIIPATLTFGVWISIKPAPINPQWNLFDQAVDLVNADIGVALWPLLTFGSSLFLWHLITSWLWRASPGKRLMGCVCIDRSGVAPRLQKLALHGLLRLLSLALLGLGHLWAIIDTQRMTLYDRFAGVIVVREDAIGRDESA